MTAADPNATNGARIACPASAIHQQHTVRRSRC
jgi:hypothetical protein